MGEYWKMNHGRNPVETSAFLQGKSRENLAAIQHFHQQPMNKRV
jgi:hypothetical protein